MEHSPTLPNGIAHLKFLTDAGEHVRAHTARHFEQHLPDMTLIGTSMNVLYKAATCQRGCHGGGHFLERLCGRAYNIGQGAWHLTTIGLYDEALNLTRGIGEIANLVGMSAVDGPAIQEWIRSDKKTRIAKFSPAKVREMLAAKAPVLMVADKDWYGDLSESYTHPTPEVRPGYHGKLDIVGGIYQEKGFEKALRVLSVALGSLAMMVCKFFKFDDLFAMLCQQIDTASTAEKKGTTSGKR